MKSIQKPIVIVGAGFAGISVALNLKNLNPSLPILVVDSASNFIFKPLMYEVLSKEIRIWEATPKFANIFSDAGITFLKNCLTKISFKDNILEFSDELKLSYQYLVICTGSLPNSFFIKGVEENCYFFNDFHDLNKLQNFLKESQKISVYKKLLIVGGGPSGIELACKIKDLFIDQFEINVIEKSNEILNRNKIFNREQAEKAIENREINVLLNSKVKETVRQAGMGEDQVTKSEMNRVSSLVVKEVTIIGYEVANSKMVNLDNGSYRTFILLEYPLAQVYKAFINRIERQSTLQKDLNAIKNTDAFKELEFLVSEFTISLIRIFK